MFSLSHPAVSAFPERVVGSACASSFSRLAQRSLSLRPAHSRCHQFVTRIPKASASSLPPWLLRLLQAGAFAGWDLHPLESAALSRRTPEADICRRSISITEAHQRRVDDRNLAIPGDDEIGSAVSRRLARAARHPTDATAIARLLRRRDRLISEVRTSSLDQLPLCGRSRRGRGKCRLCCETRSRSQPRTGPEQRNL